MAHYVNMKKLGSGGFCEVYTCRRTDDRVVFAKKLLQRCDQESEERFRKEVRMLANLDHPRIVKVIGFHVKESPLWYIMPRYKRSLADEFPDIVGKEDRIKIIFSAVLEGMQYAHEQGIVHRDLKPENILLNSDKDIVVSDFGLGLSLRSLSTRHTPTGVGFGTPGYEAPEQARDAKCCDTRSDVFALGRILYELYTGDNAPAIQDLTKVPPGIAMIVDRCTKTHPDKRFQNAGELRLALSSLWAVVDRQTDEGCVETMLANATAQGSLSKSDMATLAACMNRLRDDDDLMHKLAVELPEKVLSRLWLRNAHLARHMVTQFARQVADQGWSFTYVDTIGDACLKICRVIDDPQVRAEIVHAMVEVSVSHSRWRVMDQAADLLMTYTSPAEDLAIAEAVRPIAFRLERLEDRLQKKRLGPNVASLLES